MADQRHFFEVHLVQDVGKKAIVVWDAGFVTARDASEAIRVAKERMIRDAVVANPVEGGGAPRWRTIHFGMFRW